MPSTPVELRHVRFPRTLFRGYNRGAVDEVIEEVVASFETVWRERAELADHAELLEKQLEDLRTREALLATTLVSAEKAAADAKQQAKREAELIIAEAHGEARSITRAALADRERLFAESRRVEALLRSALGMIEEVDAPAGAQPTEGEDAAPTSWPRRDETREFARANLVVAADEEAQAG
jgi:cell division initiation protein